MSHVKKYYIGEVLKVICSSMEGISEHVFAGSRPSAVGKQMKDLVVVSLPSGLNDQKVWQRGVVRIDLIVRNRANGVAPVDRLDVMLEGVMERFPIVNKRFTVTEPRLVLRGDDGLGFTIWILQTKLIVNTTDSYEYV